MGVLMSSSLAEETCNLSCRSQKCNFLGLFISNPKTSDPRRSRHSCMEENKRLYRNTQPFPQPRHSNSISRQVFFSEGNEIL